MKFKIYISALTTLNVDEHNRISTTDGRLIRRIVRDARTEEHQQRHYRYVAIRKEEAKKDTFSLSRRSRCNV